MGLFKQSPKAAAIATPPISGRYLENDANSFRSR